MIKRQNGYVLKKIKGTAYLLPYGQNIADQKRGLIFNETGEVIWNFLDKEKTLEEIIEAVLIMKSLFRTGKNLAKM